MTERRSIVAALRARADAGASAVETARWLRAELGSEGSFIDFIALLHHAFDIPRDALRPLERWTGWNPSGRLGDAEAEALMTPMRSRPAGFDRSTLTRRPTLALPQAYDRPFVVRSYLTSHSQLVLRSQVGDDVVDLLLIGVDAMSLAAGWRRLEISAAAGALQAEMERLADVREPYDAAGHYLRLSDGERTDFVVCGNLHVLHNGAPYALGGAGLTYRPVWAPDPTATPPLRLATGFGVWAWTTAEHDLVLRARGGPVDLVFTAVRELAVRHFFGPLTIDEAPGPDGLRRYTLTDGDHDGYVVATGLRVYRG